MDLLGGFAVRNELHETPLELSRFHVSFVRNKAQHHVWNETHSI